MHGDAFPGMPQYGAWHAAAAATTIVLASHGRRFPPLHFPRDGRGRRPRADATAVATATTVSTWTTGAAVCAFICCHAPSLAVHGSSSGGAVGSSFPAEASAFPFLRVFAIARHVSIAQVSAANAAVAARAVTVAIAVHVRVSTAAPPSTPAAIVVPAVRRHVLAMIMIMIAVSRLCRPPSGVSGVA